MLEEVILSLDVSTTCTGYALYVGGKHKQYGYIKPKSKDWLTRVREMASTVASINSAYKVTHVVIEDTYFSKNIKTVKKLCIAQGIILGQLQDAELIQVYPTQWKSHFNLGKGGTKRKEQKDTSISVAEAMFLVSTKLSDDEADALLMGKYVVDTLERGDK